jgi:hypothetical protein
MKGASLFPVRLVKYASSARMGREPHRIHPGWRRVQAHAIAEYDGGDKHHVALIKLVEQAHGEHDAIKRAALVHKIESDGERILTAWMLRCQS